MIYWCYYLDIADIVADGNWGEFGAWTACSLTCGGGSQSRVRICNNPSPSGGGAPCLGSSSEERRCGEQSCPGTLTKNALKKVERPDQRAD